jgi:hypothetical protein
MNERGGSCFPSLKTLEAETGLSERSVRYSLRSLESEGWLEIDKRQGRSHTNTYVATSPEKGQEMPLFAKKGQMTTVKGAPDAPKDVRRTTKALGDKSPRARDPIWDALVDLFGAEAQGEERGRWNKAVKSLKAQGATPELVVKAAAAYRTHPTFRDCAMTAMALTTNWTLLTANGKTTHDLKAKDLRARIVAQEGQT